MHAGRDCCSSAEFLQGTRMGPVLNVQGGLKRQLQKEGFGDTQHCSPSSGAADTGAPVPTQSTGAPRCF